LLKLETVKTISTPRKINTILLNIKINQPRLVNKCGYKLAKFHGNTLSLSVNIAKSFCERGGYFFGLALFM